MKESERVRVSGPLAEYVAGFAAKLTVEGYTDLSLCNQLRVVAHFSRWLEAKRIAAPDLTRQVVDRYLRVRRRARTCWRSIRGLTPLLKFLGHAAIVEADRPRDSEVVARYRASLVDRGLSSKVQNAYLKTAQAFLDERTSAKLTSADVTAFVRQARPCNAGLLSSLRAVLRFVVLTAGPHVRCRGKGRKDRCTPLTKDAVKILRALFAERVGDPDTPAFPSRRGAALVRDTVEDLVAKHTAAATTRCATLAAKRVTPHVLRHTAAVMLLQAGNDRSVIALWLGHESIETTQMYLDADLSLKERALDRTAPLHGAKGRFRPDDELLTFLNGL